ncbi:hypothetical protein LZ318_09455 [Saccharopolyspora indica]|uniref:hypothetical protein n=1 Tax=Saccharopolyspora indica TaxID=1229659 RepID=UPI0022EA9B2A|nr:hypothetical protein [Saccharopolyspora indica]MDA3643416.1 hypothetical protein [Saccharopolyspora indica]
MLFQPSWNFFGAADGVTVSVAGGGPGRNGELARIEICRDRDAGEAIAVAWDGIDLFGHSCADVLPVLPGGREPVLAPDGSVGVVVESLGLQLLRPATREHWERLVLFSGSTGWADCCPGICACAAGGDWGAGIFK